MTGGIMHTPSHTNVCKIFSFQLTFSQLILHLKCWNFVRVFFLVLVYVFNFDLFEFSTAILEKSLLRGCRIFILSAKAGTQTKSTTITITFPAFFSPRTHSSPARFFEHSQWPRAWNKLNTNRAEQHYTQVAYSICNSTNGHVVSHHSSWCSRSNTKSNPSCSHDLRQEV